MNINGSIITYTGRLFWPLNPRLEDINALDICHALSQQCRFTGHTRQFYCVSPETRILTRDLQWKPAGELSLNEKLFGYDEFPLENHRRRKLRENKITSIGETTRPGYVFYLSDGTMLRCSEEHPWLISTKQSRNQIWRTAEAIYQDLRLNRKRYMPRFAYPWNTLTGYDAGYLAGILDGDGHCIISKTNRGLHIGFGQKPGLVLNKTLSILDKNNFSYQKLVHPISGTININIKGEWYEKFRLLGMFRPTRLLNNIMEENFIREAQAAEMVEIVEIRKLSKLDIIPLSTTTRTYIAEGFSAHNSVAEHSCRVHDILPPNLRLTGLLHDASEAYLMDLARPVKEQEQMEFFREAEEKLMYHISFKFELIYPLPEEIKIADKILLITEYRDLMDKNKLRENDFNGYKPLEKHITPWTPVQAESGMIERLEKLGVKVGR